jgi:CIC family chloride channel protein
MAEPFAQHSYSLFPKSSAVTRNIHWCCALYGSGAPGGLFAPALAIGSALGCLVGLLATLVMGPTFLSTFALVGMGAFFSAVARVPITAIVIVFEITHGFTLVLPLMISCIAASFIAEELYSGSIYERLLEWGGIHLSDPVKLTRLFVRDVANPAAVSVSLSLPIADLRALFEKSQHVGFPVLEDGKLVGLVTKSDLAKLTAKTELESATVKDLMTADPVFVGLENDLADVLYLFDQKRVRLLPVVENQKLIGVITRSDIVRTLFKELLSDPNRSEKTN